MNTNDKPVLGIPAPLPLQTRTFKAIDDTYTCHVLIGDQVVAESTGHEKAEDAVKDAREQFVATLRKRRPRKKRS